MSGSGAGCETCRPAAVPAPVETISARARRGSADEIPVVFLSRPPFASLVLAIALMPACGRIGYDPVPEVVTRVDGGALTDAGPDLPAADVAGLDLPAGDLGGNDPLPDEVAAPALSDSRAESPIDLPAIPSERPPDTAGDVAPDLPPDAAPAPTGTGPNGTTACLANPPRQDLLADFEDGTLRLVQIDGRGGALFHFVTSGAGELGIATGSPAQQSCGSPVFMVLRGTAIPTGRNGHIQALFIDVPPGGNREYDARAFSGVRLSLRSTRPLLVNLKIPDLNTSAEMAYDHFSLALNVTTGWRTYVIPFTSLRQSGVGTAQPALDLRRLYGLELQILDRDFELQVDTIAFVR